YLDTFRFFGAMLVVLKVMMKESIIFFALLAVLIIGFLQAFVGLDAAEDMAVDDYALIFKAMANAIMQSPDMDVFDEFSPPFGTILYYFFTFIVMVILLNILIALYNSAYEDIYQNANDEFLALFAQKTMQFVRAPDENVYIPPFNLVEMVVIALVGWWMPKERFEHLNDIVMAVFYSPVLLIAAYAETRTAKEIQRNRSNGEEDDDVNNLERRKQEEQFAMAQQREVMMRQQAITRIQPGGIQGSLHHHSSAHSLQSQPSFGSIASPIGAPLQQPPTSNMAPGSGYYDGASQQQQQQQQQQQGNGQGPVGAGQDPFREDDMPTVNANHSNAPSQGSFFPPQPIGGAQGNDNHVRANLPGTEQLAEDDEGFRERLKEFEGLR
ncbi:hypothetical protein BN1723_018130, partial [Verticillium longisporum]